MRYLGVILDSKLSFGPHLEFAETKTARVMRSLGRLMPNLRGPIEERRRLYGGVLISILLYGAPVWGNEFIASRARQTGFRRLYRSIAARMVSAYRTVSYDAVCVLARMVPIAILVECRSRTFRGIAALKEEDAWSITAAKRVRDYEEACSRELWWDYLHSGDATSGAWTRMAILPYFYEWLDRSHGGLTYRITQLLTGHGCFQKFLFHINRTESPKYMHCSEDVVDDAEHTVGFCVAWSEEQDVLLANGVGGNGLALASVVGDILSSPEAWSTFAVFAESVLREKEDAGRRREVENAILIPLPPGNDRMSGEET